MDSEHVKYAVAVIATCAIGGGVVAWIAWDVIQWLN